MNLFQRRFGIIAALLVLIAQAAAFRILQSKKADPPKREEQQAKMRSVEVLTVVPAAVNTEIDILGRILPYERVEIYSEVGGVMQRGAADFEEGISLANGAQLCRIDDTEPV
jgi:hypothetical protein